MADKSKEPAFVEDAAGHVRRVSADRLGNFADKEPISPTTASETGQQESDRAFAEDALGGTGAAAMGFANELGLGLPSTLAIKGFEAVGDDYNAGVGRRLFSGLGQMGSYEAGQAAGLVAPALATGGESLLARTPAGMLGSAGGLAERLAGRLLPEATGLLGSAVKPAIKLAARGSAEGAIIGLTNQVSQNAIRNVPLTAEAMAATGQGALFGGLAGGAIGAVGGVAGAAAEKVLGVLGGSKGTDRILRRAGLTSEEISRIGSKGGDTAEEWAARARRALGTESSQGAGDAASWASDTGVIAGKAGRDAANAGKVRQAVLEQLDTEASSFAPSVDRIRQRAITELGGRYEGTPFYQKAVKTINKVTDALFGEEERLGAYTAKPGSAGKVIDTEFTKTPTSWQKLGQTRDQLAKDFDRIVGQTGSGKKLFTREMMQDFVGIMDSEMKTSMDAAAMANEGLKGIGDSYASNTLLQKTMEELKDAASRKASQAPAGMSVGVGDVAKSALLQGLGHPIAAALGLASGVARKQAGNVIEPWLAELAWKNSQMAKAGAQTEMVRSKIASSLNSLLLGGPEKASKSVYRTVLSKAGGKGQKLSADAIYDDMEQTRHYLSESHRQKVNDYADWQSQNINPAMGKATVDAYNRATEYMQYNLPPGKAAKKATTLRPMPEMHGPDMQMLRYMRQSKAIKNPLSLLDDMESGSISRDAVQAVKYVYPELHKEIVTQAATQIWQMKSEGKTLPMDKVVSLGIVLDSPIDSILQKETVDAIQASFTVPPAPQDQAPSGDPSIIPSFQSPLEKILS